MEPNIFIQLGDITKSTTEAIVNAANTTLLGGGGVDGAIHRVAGPQLLDECRKLNGCQTGEAKITKAYNLPAKYVIHTPGPIYKNGKNKEAELLKNCYLNSLLIAKDYKLKSIAFPAISTGVYHFPKKEAAEIALKTVINFIKNNYLLDVYFVLYDSKNYQIYQDFWQSIKTNKGII